MNKNSNDPVEQFESQWKELAKPENTPVSGDFTFRLNARLSRPKPRFSIPMAPAFVGFAAVVLILMVCLVKAPGDPITQFTAVIPPGTSSPVDLKPAQGSAPGMVTLWLDRETPLYLALKTNNSVKGEQI